MFQTEGKLVWSKEGFCFGKKKKKGKTGMKLISPPINNIIGNVDFMISGTYMVMADNYNHNSSRPIFLLKTIKF